MSKKPIIVFEGIEGSGKTHHISIKSNFNKNTDLLLYMAARSENINLIKKSYKKKSYLLIDLLTLQ